MLAAAVAVVASALLSLLNGWPSALEPAAEFIMEWTPVPVASFLLLHAGSLARPAALCGALALLLVLGGGAGALAALGGRSLVGRGVGLILAAVFLGLALLRWLPGSSLAPQLVIVVLFPLVWTLLDVRVQPVSGRREFLMQSGTLVAATASLLSLWAARPLLLSVPRRRLFPFRPPAGLAVSGLTPPVTPTTDFYLMDKVLQYPQIQLDHWQLMIDGAVRRPIRLNHAALLARPNRHQYVTLECVDNPVGGPLISTALWTGVRLQDLLNEAQAEGDVIAFHAADGYVESVPRGLIQAADALVVWAMNGEILPVSHGYPARIVIPGVYGFKSVKWLQRIEVSWGARAGNWQAHGWADAPRIHTTTRIDVARRLGAELLLAGIAFGGSRGVRAVEIRMDGGRWRRATLGSSLSRDSWVQWVIRLRAPREVLVEARAIDGEGRVQRREQHGPYPAGATGWASVRV